MGLYHSASVVVGVPLHDIIRVDLMPRTINTRRVLVFGVEVSALQPDDEQQWATYLDLDIHGGEGQPPIVGVSVAYIHEHGNVFPMPIADAAVSKATDTVRRKLHAHAVKLEARGVDIAAMVRTWLVLMAR